MHKLQEIFRDTLASGLKRKAVTDCAKWASAYRMMGKPFPGLWTPKHHPWTLEMHNTRAEFCVGQKSAQMGYTETMLNVTFYHIDILRSDCLYVLPSKTPDASDFSAARFDAALDLAPHLTNLFSDVKNVGHKRAGATNLYVRGSNSRGGMKGLPVGLIVFDELDEMNQANVTLGEERVSGQVEWQIWKISTPTVPDHGINKEFLLSTQEHFIFKCPRCNRRTEFIFPECLIITADDRLDPKIKDSYYICKECKGLLVHEEKPNFLGDGYWVPRVQSDKRGFHVNQLYSYTIKPHQLASKYLASLVDKVEEQEFYNSKLGIPHVPEGARVTDTEIKECTKDYLRVTSIASSEKIITMGVDQGRWLHYEIASWDFPKLGNDLNMTAECKVLAEGKVANFTELGQLMKQFQILFCVLDAQPERRLAYEFACDFYGHVKLCFYSTGVRGKMIKINDDEDLHELSVDRTSWLDVSLNRFHNRTISLPRDVSLEYQQHIKKLIRRYTKDASGNPVGSYITTGDGVDHLAHARCYNEIALPCAATLVTNENIRSFL